MTAATEEHARRKLDELAARFELEPTMRDLVVEGSSDVCFWRWWASERQYHHVVAYEVDTIEVPLELLRELSLPNNNRGRVIAVAMVMERLLGAQALQVTCLIDSDLEYLLAAQGARSAATNLALLLKTDFSSVEMYAFGERPLRKYVELFCRLPACNVDALSTSLQAILVWLFCVRAANESLGWCLKALDLFRSLKLTQSLPEIDRASHLERYLKKNGRYNERDHMMQEVERHLAAALQVADPRQCMHGHDYVAVLGWYGREASKRLRGSSCEQIGRAVLACCESSDLDQHQTVQMLRARVER